MNLARSRVVITVLALAFVARNVNAAEPANFYQGKTVRIVVGLAAGGGYDLYARTLARHLGKHIPGNPAIVVENMTGAGSIIAGNISTKLPSRTASPSATIWAALPCNSYSPGRASSSML